MNICLLVAYLHLLPEHDLEEVGRVPKKPLHPIIRFTPVEELMKATAVQ